MKTKISVLFLIILGLLLFGVQMNAYSMDMGQAVQNAKTPADHEALAKYYDAAAKEMQSKVQEHQKMYEKYQACLLYTSPSPRDGLLSRMPSSA